MKNEILFYATVFMRRIHYFILIFGVIAAASVTISRLLPSVYQASATMLVEAPQIPTNLAASTIQTSATEELQIFQKRLMTRLNLLDIAREQNVFDEIETMSPDQIVRAMRRSTGINLSTGRGQATVMNISFEAKSGQIAAAVVNQFITLILQENAADRANRAGGTLEFFEIEVERLGLELERQNIVILEYSNANADALPQTLAYRLTQQTALQTSLAATEREITLLVEQKRRLNEIFEATGTVGPSAAFSLTPEQQKLAALEASLSQALAVYSDANPRVILLKKQIAQQKALVNEQAGISQSGSTPQATILDVQLADIDARLEIFETQRLQSIEQLALLEDSIDRTPAVSIALAAYNRDYTNVQLQYNRAVDGLSLAATGERIELSAKGQRLTVIDPATVPSEPSRPNRNLIAVGGSLFGAMAGFAVIFGLELLNTSIRRAADITNNLGITPIATVPYIRTPLEMVLRRAAFVVAFVVLVFGLPAALFAVHTYYLPLDLIFDQLTEKIGEML